MKKVVLILVLSLLFIVPVKAENVFNYKNGLAICNGVKTNSEIKIFVYSNYDKKSYRMESSTTSCNNSTYYNNNLSKIEKGASYVAYDISPTSYEIYSDNVLLKESGKTNEYSYFRISNRNRADTIARFSTLKPHEKVVLTIDASGKKIKTDKYKDLRLTMKVGATASDVNLASFNSIAYYLITNNKTYGPYKLFESSLDNVYQEKSADGKLTKIVTYNLVSSNLLQNVPSGLDITGIKIVPYEYYTVRTGFLRMFGISLDGYASSYSSKKYVGVTNAENVVRHNVVNNMLEVATIKWEIADTDNLYFYCRLTSKPNIVEPKKTMYGLLYGNEIDTTINAFITKTTKNTKSSSKPYFSYKFTVPSSARKNHNIYIYEPAGEKYNTPARLDDLAKNPFIENTDYFYSVDCSSSTFLANGRELPYTETMATSARYLYGNHAQPIGGLSISIYAVEKYLRDKNILKKNEQMTQAIFSENYDKYIYDIKGKEALYNAYGLLIPGDYVTAWGHVRMETGYPYVVCNDGKHKFGGKLSTKYKTDACKNYGGIDPNNSYVITTEVGGSNLNRKYEKDSTGNYFVANDSGVRTEYIAKENTGWTYSFNPELTDITNLTQYYTTKNKTAFRVNKKYTFAALINNKNTNIYLPFRYDSMTKVMSTKKIEIPTAKIALGKTYSNNNQEIYDYMYKSKKLKGTILTNYMIDGIKIQINGTKYYIYPNQTNKFSLYNDIKDKNILNAIKSLDYKTKNKVIISVLMGPNIASVKKAAGADSEGYIKVIDTTGLTPTAVIKTTSIKLSSSSVKIVGIGKTKKLTATLEPTNATEKSITWTSSNTAIATVSSTGLITAKKPGTVTVTVKTKDTGKTATANVVVVQPVSGIKLSKTNTHINVNKTETIKATIEPSDASNKKVIWTSSNTSIASVSSTGKITAIKSGQAIITAETEDGNFKSNIVVNVVVPVVAVTSVTLDKTELVLNDKDTETLNATILPANATNQGVVWTSDNTSVVTVSEGVVTAKKPGTANITVTTNDGNKVSICKVVVNEVKVSDIKINNTNVELEIGDTYKLVLTIEPNNATDKTVTWTSSDTTIATVSSSGLITAKKSGTATITAKTKDGSKSVTSTVKVIKEETTEPVAVEEDELEVEEAPSTVVPIDPVKPTETTKPSNSTKTSETQPQVEQKDEEVENPITSDDSNETIEIEEPINQTKDTNLNKPIIITVISFIVVCIAAYISKLIKKRKNEKEIIETKVMTTNIDRTNHKNKFIPEDYYDDKKSNKN